VREKGEKFSPAFLGKRGEKRRHYNRYKSEYKFLGIYKGELWAKKKKALRKRGQRRFHKEKKGDIFSSRESHPVLMKKKTNHTQRKKKGDPFRRLTEGLHSFTPRKDRHVSRSLKGKGTIAEVREKRNKRGKKTFVSARGREVSRVEG